MSFTKNQDWHSGGIDRARKYNSYHNIAAAETLFRLGIAIE